MKKPTEPNIPRPEKMNLTDFGAFTEDRPADFVFDESIPETIDVEVGTLPFEEGRFSLLDVQEIARDYSDGHLEILVQKDSVLVIQVKENPAFFHQQNTAKACSLEQEAWDAAKAEYDAFWTQENTEAKHQWVRYDMRLHTYEMHQTREAIREHQKKLKSMKASVGDFDWDKDEDLVEPDPIHAEE